MALSEKHRNTIYQHLAPAWGEDVTQAFLSQFPAHEGEEPLTRDHLRAEFALQRTELLEQRVELVAMIAEVDTRLTGQIADLDTRLTGQIAALGARLSTLIISTSGVLVAAVAAATAVLRAG